MKNLSGYSVSGFSSSQILFAVFCWSLLILRFGYRFGTGDQVELLPYTLFLQNPHLYPHDFFIQGLHASVPNERTVMATLLLPFANHLEIVCFLLQCLCTVALVLGLQKLSLRFITNKYLVWLAILIALIPLNDFTLGNVELYSECFQASGLAIAIVVWALNYYLDKKYARASFFMSVATFIQLLEGLDTMLLLSSVLLIATVRKEVSFKTFFAFIGIYGCTAGVYLMFILLKKSLQADVTDSELFAILFQFRHPHHFIFSSFSKVKVIVFAVLSLVALFYFYNKSKSVFRFITVGLAGVVVYVVAVDVFQFIPIANFQFYKVTVWIKFLGVVALLSLADKYFSVAMEKLASVLNESLFLTVSAVFCWIVVLFFADYLPYQVPSQIFRFKEKDEMVSICTDIKVVVPSDAVFIQPFDNTELKFYAQRSSYVEFKANVRNKLFVRQWAERIEDVFGVNPSNAVRGFELKQQADNYFYSLTSERLELLKQKGVTHLLTIIKMKPATGKLILHNSSYAVYQL